MLYCSADETLFVEPKAKNIEHYIILHTKLRPYTYASVLHFVVQPLHKHDQAIFLLHVFLSAQLKNQIRQK